MVVLVLAAVGVTSVLSMATVVINQSKEIKRFELKVALKDVQADVEQGLGDRPSCDLSFPGSSWSFDGDRVGDASYQVPVNAIIEAGAVNRTILAPNQVLGGQVGRARVERLFASNFVLVGVEQYSFDLTAFVTHPSVGNVGSIKVAGIQMSTDPGSNPVKKPLACGFSKVPRTPTCHTVVAPAVGTAKLQINCGADEFLVSGGGACRKYSPGLAHLAFGEPPEVLGYLISNRPNGNGWEVDCYNYAASDLIWADGYAYCCRRF